MHKYKSYIQKGKYKLIDCKICGFKHLLPIQRDSKLNKYYKSNYSDKLEKINVKDKLETLTKCLGRGKKRILDVGCGNGKLLKVFKENGWETCGIEPSSQAFSKEDKKELNIICRTFENVNFKSLGVFDAVMLSFILEHISSPIELLKKIHPILREGGVICIEVPNDFNELQEVLVKQLGKERWWIVIPDHINYFSIDSLSKLVERIGFKKLLAEGSFPVEIFALMGEDYIGNPAVGEKIHQKRLSFEQNLIKSGKNQLKRKLYQKLIEMGIGRSIILYATKQNPK